MKMVGMALPPGGGGDTTPSSTDVTQSIERQQNDSKPEAYLFKRNSAESSGTASSYTSQ
jgi:hypothetical protein